MPDDKSLGFHKIQKELSDTIKTANLWFKDIKDVSWELQNDRLTQSVLYMQKAISRLRYCDKQLMEWETTNSTLVKQSRPKN